MKKFTKLLCFIFVAAIACALAGCAQNNINVKITDMFSETRLSTSVGKTVEEILAESEIELGEKDTVTPSQSTVIDKNSTINISRYTTSTVVCDGRTTEVALSGATVSDALKSAGVKVSENDYVNYDLSAYVTDGMKISVTRRLEVSLTVDGKTESFKTQSKTVEDFLKELNVKLGKKDMVTPALSENLKENTKVTVKRVTTKTVTKTEVIEYSTKYENSSSMAAGTSKVTVSGKNGEKEVTYRITYVDGKEKNRKVIKETVKKEPVDEVIAQGVKSAATQPATQKTTSSNGKTEVSRQRVDDCDGSGHGYFIIKYSDGSVEYEDY